MNRTVCGICWALYDDEGLCECPQVKEKHMTTLREAAQQALEALEALDALLFGVVDHYELDRRKQALRAALAQQEQPNRAQRMRDAGYTRRPTLREMVEREPGPKPEPEPGVCGRCGGLVYDPVVVQQEQEEPEGGWQSAPSPQVTQRIADMPMSEYRRGVNDGFKLGLREGRIKAEDERHGGEAMSTQNESLREMLIGAAAMAVAAERRGVYPGASAVADAVLEEQEPVAWTDRELELIEGMIEVQLRHAAQCDAIANRTMAERQKGWDMERVALLHKIKSNPPRREWQGLTEEEIEDMSVTGTDSELRRQQFARAIEAALKEKNV